MVRPLPRDPRPHVERLEDQLLAANKTLVKGGLPRDELVPVVARIRQLTDELTRLHSVGRPQVNAPASARRPAPAGGRTGTCDHR
ncbi:hypothetical protein AB0G74_16740 [Streptomyces sp. NPDC020875]|uniref:hypothetical protein n=1 Tax=Streptomyces sp. NPDC020875 TaxID=3154898 RepID=UPI0033D2D375